MMLEKELEDIFQQTHRKWKSTARTVIKNLADSAGTGICFIRSSPEQYEKDMEIIYRVKVDWVNMGE